MFQCISSDWEQIYNLETPDIYKLSYPNEEGANRYYIGITKQKITGKIKECNSDDQTYKI